MVVLTMFLAVLGADEIKSQELEKFDTFAQCEAAAFSFVEWVAQGTGPDMKTLAVGEGIIVLEHPNGDQMALTCKEKESV